MIPRGASDPLAPLRHFHPVPEVRFVPSSSLPHSVRSLLAHDGDMTSRLARAYGSDIMLEVVQHFTTDTVLAREVVLRTTSGEAVEYGAIEISLSNLSPDVKAAVILQREPFGGILNRFGIGYYSAPSAYLSIQSCDLPHPAFSVTGECFARCNVLRDFDGRELARIVEVLSPLAIRLEPRECARPPFNRDRYDSIHLGASSSHCLRAVEEAGSGKTVLLLARSGSHEPAGDVAKDVDGIGSSDIFSLLLAARRAGVEVHEETDFRTLNSTEIIATPRDGSEHHIRGETIHL